jgi:hypothetical protein
MIKTESFSLADQRSSALHGLVRPSLYINSGFADFDVWPMASKRCACQDRHRAPRSKGVASRSHKAYGQ